MLSRVSSVLMKFPSNETNIHCRKVALSREPPPPLPRGLMLGETLYFIGPTHPIEDQANEYIVHGSQVVLIGPDLLDDSRVVVKFPGSDDSFSSTCPLNTLSRSPPPPLPGGYKLGDTLYYIGDNYNFDAGYRLAHGQKVEVIGPDFDLGDEVQPYHLLGDEGWDNQIFTPGPSPVWIPTSVISPF